MTDQRSKKSPNYVFFVTTVANYLHVRLVLLDISILRSLTKREGMASEAGRFREQCNALGKRNLAAIPPWATRALFAAYSRG